jgi:hypothetical protein
MAGEAGLPVGEAFPMIAAAEFRGTDTGVTRETFFWLSGTPGPLCSDDPKLGAGAMV